MVKNPDPHFDQSFDQPIHGPPHFFSPNIELPDHMQEVVSQNPHLHLPLASIIGAPEDPNAAG
jgi:hypothetical protein